MMCECFIGIATFINKLLIAVWSVFACLAIVHTSAARIRTDSPGSHLWEAAIAVVLISVSTLCTDARKKSAGGLAAIISSCCGALIALGLAVWVSYETITFSGSSTDPKAQHLRFMMLVWLVYIGSLVAIGICFSIVKCTIRWCRMRHRRTPRARILSQDLDGEPTGDPGHNLKSSTEAGDDTLKKPFIDDLEQGKIDSSTLATQHIV